MYVCADEEMPRVIGWTTADAREGDRLEIARWDRLPRTFGPLSISDKAQVETTIFRIITADLPWGRERVIKLEGDQDPSILPGWSPIPARPPHGSRGWRPDPVVDRWRGVWGTGHHNYLRIDPEIAARSRERARGLLKSLLTPQQWAEFESAGQVTEIINGTDFRLAPGAMIEVRRPKLKVEKWCVYPNPYEDSNDYMPDEDKLIGQLLHLRAGPDKLRERANVFPDGGGDGYEHPYGLGYAITHRLYR